MIVQNKVRFLILILALLSAISSKAQVEKVQELDTTRSNTALYNELDFLRFRGTHVIDAAFGTSLLLGDYPEASPDIFFRIGYKYHINRNLNINLSFNKYNLTISEDFNQGYMSFDLNLEYLVMPNKAFTPFLFGGYGYNASNYFEETQTKVQFGLGLEYMVMDGLGLKLFGDYNYVLSNEMEGLILPENDESFLRIGLGVNLYLGGNKRKEQILNQIDTVINSNLIN
jgi:curli production assembly/transport component CsgG